MSYHLFLDDVRMPGDASWIRLPSARYDIVRSYDEFVEFIQERGVPEFVSFDHDLADEHYVAMLLESQGKHADYGPEKSGYKCEGCELTEWRGKPITLELEHKNADRKDNTRENLQLLCPNCHAQTPTWRRGLTTGFKKKRYSDEVMIDAIKSSYTLNAVLEKLDLRYGSVKTIVDLISKHNLSFMKKDE